MAQALQAIGQLVFPLPLAARVYGAIRRALARAARISGSGEAPSVSPVSPAWLLEHEIASRKRSDEL